MPVIRVSRTIAPPLRPIPGNVADDASKIPRTPRAAPDLAERIFTTAPILASLNLNTPECAAPLAQALAETGIALVEISIRPRMARRILRTFAETPGLIAGCADVLTPEDALAAQDAGARFCTAPGRP